MSRESLSGSIQGLVMATRIEATYEVTTPMFCGGAKQEPELRLPSFKGLLRFWWRALAWSRLGGDLKRIKDEEDRLFGSSATGRSRVLLQALSPRGDRAVLGRSQVLTVTPATKSPVGPGARYLGYGVMEAFASRTRGTKEAQLTRSCIRGPFEFTVELAIRGLDDNDCRTVCDALTALGLFGGMGAKSRKGYGSLVLRSLRCDGQDAWKPPETFDVLEAAVRDLFERAGVLGGTSGAASSNGYPEYTALSRKSRCVLLIAEDAREPLETLDRIGREMIRYRSWGHGGKILGGEDSERNFKDDHDLMKQSPPARRSHPRRIAFGLPHNYGKGRERQVGPEDAGLDRRASPLLIHIHRCGSKPVAVLTFLPARFLPARRNGISVGGNPVPQQPEPTLYQPVEAFLDRLLDEKQRREPFSLAREVKA